jgi:hypothetical protein
VKRARNAKVSTKKPPVAKRQRSLRSPPSSPPAEYVVEDSDYCPSPARQKIPNPTTRNSPLNLRNQHIISDSCAPSIPHAAVVVPPFRSVDVPAAQHPVNTAQHPVSTSYSTSGDNFQQLSHHLKMQRILDEQAQGEMLANMNTNNVLMMQQQHHITAMLNQETNHKRAEQMKNLKLQADMAFLQSMMPR